jgi:hypothetical protein
MSLLKKRIFLNKKKIRILPFRSLNLFCCSSVGNNSRTVNPSPLSLSNHCRQTNQYSSIFRLAEIIGLLRRNPSLLKPFFCLSDDSLKCR